MFGVYYYVPILRWKRAEKFALKYLNSVDRAYITPLIEFIPANFRPGKDGSEKEPAEVLDEQAHEIRKNWGSAPFRMQHNTAQSNSPSTLPLTCWGPARALTRAAAYWPRMSWR